MEEFQGNVVPSNSDLGFQVGRRTLVECSTSLLSTEVSLGLSLFLSFATLGPLVGQSPPPQCPSPSSFSSTSLDQGASREGKEKGEGEDWEEARSLGHPWTMTSCSS